MKRLISQALAIRSTCTPLRVTQTAPFTGRGATAFGGARLVGSAARSRRSKAASSDAVASRPGAPKKSSSAISPRRRRKRASAASAAARLASSIRRALPSALVADADLARELLVVLARGPRGTAPRARSFGRAADEARLAHRGLAAAGRDLLRQPGEALVGAVGVRQHVDRVLHGDRADLLELPRRSSRAGRRARAAAGGSAAASAARLAGGSPSPRSIEQSYRQVIRKIQMYRGAATAS